MGAIHNNLRLGIDIGSTTVKLSVVDVINRKQLYSLYRRHNADQITTVKELLQEAGRAFPEEKFRMAVCGSGGKPVAAALGISYIQEVVANATAVEKTYPDVRTAIELGGQDAKVVFFHYDEDKEQLRTSDMRMNGSCAGGTGAFIDEIASLLHIRPEEFEGTASRGTRVYDISGRCGVFAKTDIQPLLIQGAAKEDVALSALHAITKQTIGGLSQGLKLTPPIIFEGGPLTFNPTLIQVFAQRLGLKEIDIILPEHPETFVAMGAALAVDKLFQDMHDGEVLMTMAEAANKMAEYKAPAEGHLDVKPLFENAKQLESFLERHKAEIGEKVPPSEGQKAIKAYMGIDSGSTTSKIVLMDERQQIIDTWYSNNRGDALRTVRSGILELRDKYAEQGIPLEILGLGTTGYGEKLMAEAFGADAHIVETVAHTQGCCNFVPDATFILDIGGQDMKAIWLKDGVSSNIVLNEACSSGCGSFLESFAHSLGIEVEGIADSAFRASNPAALGSRCTVFMNSTIINEQRLGKAADDIMAGLCRSIIENVFTKVVRISSPEELGDKVVVQGGTFRNMAVLRALEEYLEKEVILAPFPGEMGAVGAAIIAKNSIADSAENKTAFAGFDAIAAFDCSAEPYEPCNFCENHCRRMVINLPSGSSWITGNRCERGFSGGSRKLDPERETGPVDLFTVRRELLLKDYYFQNTSPPRKYTIGIPSVLEFWDSMPFWTTFFHALGFETKISEPSSRKMYERGLQYVASDTICFPAKLVHGHILDLAEQNVDKIFMPYVMHMPPEGTDKLSPYVCSVVMGYPMVVRNTQNPEELYGIEFDTPVFHWFTEKDRRKQICRYAEEELGVSRQAASEAFIQAEEALKDFRRTLQRKGAEVLEQARRDGSFAVVLAGRPYHGDPLINHGISKMFRDQGISVLTVDSIPDFSKTDLDNIRIEITNNYHTRMLTAAKAAAQIPELEYAQIVSFGCGHDAVLSDEIIRIVSESSGKIPLVLKMDESDATGSLGIRVKSFLETVKLRRARGESGKEFRPLPDPYTAKFIKADKKERILLIPNIAEDVMKVMCSVLKRAGYKAETIPLGGMHEIQLGKKHVHNDICFPAQMVIGEAIAALQRSDKPHEELAVGMIKFQCDCRMSHYAALLRKGMDSAGFKDVPILTTDINDTKNMHQGVALLGLGAVIEAIWVFMMLDIIKEICRKIRPYEINKGETDRVYEEITDVLAAAVADGLSECKKVFKNAIDMLCDIPYDRMNLKPRVLVTGELLVTYHPGSNFDIERYLERNGMETVFPRVTDQLRKDFLAQVAHIQDFNISMPPYPYLVDWMFDYVQRKLEGIAQKHPLSEETLKPKDLYSHVQDIIPKTLSCGEGWLMAAEIAYYAKEDVESFVILQPFGCLPNHICGRGVIRQLKERFPNIHVLPLDLDPDTSFANVENRLQMLIMNSRDNQRKG